MKESMKSIVWGGVWLNRKRIGGEEKRNKGFTLVELIVVIVILAILAAILIPGMLKWIDEAKNKQYALEARNILMATEAQVARVYADGEIENAEIFDVNSCEVSLQIEGDENDNDNEHPKMLEEIKKMTGVETIHLLEYEKEGNIVRFSVRFVASDNKRTEAEYGYTGKEWKIYLDTWG